YPKLEHFPHKEFWVYVFSLGICLVCGWWLFWGRFIFCY
ncbi:hypothetical protein PUR50_31765, partial [Enterobacter hormaechei subsp. steigerwaltii]|nr:hypothetical protein [Enterobacter hormaechei subsp. steigerwaltii]